MGLQEEIDKMRPKIRTDDYDMSIGEWISLYDKGEVDIHPEFQRFFRWKLIQKTRFIESILLGIPIPPIFVSQREDGIWDVVDGLQRLSTIYEFLGILKDENGRLVEPLVMVGTKYLPSLEGKVWDNESNPEKSFNVAQRLFIKRSKFHVNIILKESGELAKYELFQRINTGGSQLSDQEVRNCILLQQNREMFEWLSKLSQDENFKECTVITERASDEQYGLELVLRFVVLRSIEEEMLDNVGDMGEFLTARMIDIATDSNVDYGEEEEAFKKTFDILYKSTKENSFRRYDQRKGKFLGGFLVTPFEVVALGIGYNYSKPGIGDIDVEERVKRFWSEEQPGLQAGSGVRASSRIPTTIKIGRRIFAP